MTRKFLSVILAGCCGWTLAGLTAQAATVSATTPAAAPAISDAEAMRYLKPPELAQWKAAAQKIKDGQSEVEDGKFLQASTAADAADAIQSDIAGKHKKGDTEVKEGNAKIKDGTTVQDKLRLVAISNRDAAHQQASATASASFNVQTGQWPEAIQSMSANLLGQLGDEKYTQIYFGGVYSFDETSYSPKPDLSTQALNQLLQLDKDKKAMVDVPASSIKLAQENGKLIFTYPSRTTDQQNGIKAAMIVGEVLYEMNNGYAAFSLRAIDLSNLHVVASQLMILSVEPSMAKMLGLPSFRVMARREVPPSKEVPADASTTDTKATDKPAADTAEAPVITVNLQDPNNTLASFKNSSYVFRMATSGHANNLENRYASLMVKSYFHDQQPDVPISDQDFITLAFSADADTAAASPADVNTAWVLPNVSDLNVPSIDLDALTARDLNKNASVKIGKITIEQSLPKLSLPSGAELRAGGYSG